MRIISFSRIHSSMTTSRFTCAQYFFLLVRINYGIDIAQTQEKKDE